MSQKTGGPSAPETKPAAAPAQDPHAELEQLRAQVAQQREQLAALQAQIEELQRPARGAQAQELPTAKAGHVWCYTRYPYVVEAYEGARFRPRTVPPNTAVEVSLKELEIDRLRRFPHLETVEVRAERLAVIQERTTAPIQEHMDNVAGAFADAAHRVEVREQHRAAALATILNPERLAGQLPE